MVFAPTPLPTTATVDPPRWLDGAGRSAPRNTCAIWRSRIPQTLPDMPASGGTTCRHPYAWRFSTLKLQHLRRRNGRGCPTNAEPMDVRRGADRHHRHRPGCGGYLLTARRLRTLNCDDDACRGHLHLCPCLDTRKPVREPSYAGSLRRALPAFRRPWTGPAAASRRR